MLARVCIRVSVCVHCVCMCVCACVSVCACNVYEEKVHPLHQVFKVLCPRRLRVRGAGQDLRKLLGFMSPCSCSACEGPGHHQILPAAVQAGRLGVGAELCHRGSQQPLLPAPLHRECQLCPHVSKSALFVSLLALFLCPSPHRSRCHLPLLSPSKTLRVPFCLAGITQSLGRSQWWQ